MNFLLLEEVDSTNSYVSLHASELDDMTMVIADRQTAGRGQRGNSWESEPGKNLTFTLLARPKNIRPCEQFSVSEAVALGVVDFLRSAGIPACVKWPNDIYVDNSKISGILIEHSITSTAIEHSRIGVGLNVNQQEFRSDAPNPISMAQIRGTLYDISRVAAAVGTRIEERLGQAYTAEGRAELHDEFKRKLWRGDGAAHPFRRRDDGKTFAGVIKNVSESGPIEILDTETDCVYEFAFKEVEFVL